MNENTSPAPAERLVASRGVVEPDERKAAQIEMHNAIQWLARVAHSYSAAPNERLSLHFDEDARTLYTPDLARATRLGLHLHDLVFQFHEQGVATPHALDVEDRSSTEVEAWLLAEFLHRGLDRSQFKKELPYAWDGQMSGDETKYGPHRLSERLRHLTQEFVEAATALRKARRIAADGAKSQGPSSDLLFWPDLCAVGFTLAGEAGHVEASYGPIDGGARHFQVSSHGIGPEERILISKAPAAESVVREIVEAISSLARG